MTAIADVRDGLTPRARRVLSNLTDRYATCARLVDSEEDYDCLVSLAQSFTTRYPLVWGRGNFGSIDDDPAASAQYTEARLAPLGRELEWFPNLLVNGSESVPPHNLREVAAAVIAQLEAPALDASALLEHLPGPDFPTGGVIASLDGVRELYETGRGAFRLRGRAHAEAAALVITELPYGIVKASGEGVLKEIIAMFAHGRDAQIENIADRSDRGRLRVVLTLVPGADPNALLRALYEHTSMQIEIHAELIGLVNGSSQRLSLPEMIRHWLAGRDHARVRSELQAVAERFGDDRRTVLGA